jgi:hypothetical protein
MRYSLSSEIILIILRPVAFCSLILFFVRKSTSLSFYFNGNVGFSLGYDLIFSVCYVLLFKNLITLTEPGNGLTCDFLFSVLTLKVILHISDLNV